MQIEIGNAFIELPEFQSGKESSGSDASNASAYNLKKWVESTKENGGYYIGRYEASYASGNNIENYKAASKISKYFRTEEDGSMEYIPGTLWNWISQVNASKVAINTYTDSDNGIKSDLINSYAWDTAILYIQEAGNEIYSYCTSKNTTLSNTGTNDDEVCKINDMASNCVEWTTEYCSASKEEIVLPYVYRGGLYYKKDKSTCRSFWRSIGVFV